MGTSYRQLWHKKQDSVQAGMTKNVDTIPMSKFNRLEYGLQYNENGGPKTKAVKISVVKDDILVNDQVFAKHGNGIDVEINAIVTGTNFHLQVINNESFDIDLSFARLIL